MSKYKELDARVFKWLAKHRTDVSTARVFRALRITDSVQQRHISRRFTQLEDRGVLVCKLKRTERICRVVQDPPKTLAKKRWTSKKPATPLPAIPSIPASDSNEFEKAGGTIQRLETHWGKQLTQIPLGQLTFLDLVNDLD